jgi:molybdopterin-guanine dinucleotide biosynthesis protein B
MSNRLPIVNVIGYSNSGKTRCIVELVAILTRRGYRIATAKHCHEGFQLDREGKDSWTHKRAGAVATLLSGNGQIGLIQDVGESLPLQFIAERFIREADLLLAEGFSWEPTPKILVVKGTNFEAAKNASSDTLFALVCDERLDSSLPQFGFSDLEHLATLIEQQFLASPSSSSSQETIKAIELLTASPASFLSLLAAHAHLDALFLLHQEALLALDVASALQTLTQYQQALDAHMRYEEELLLPVYKRAGRIQGGAVEFFTGEHQRMREMLERIEEALDHLWRSPADLRRHIIELFDREAAFKQLAEHHDQRERNTFYPTLDKVTAEAERRTLLKSHP